MMVNRVFWVILAAVVLAATGCATTPGQSARDQAAPELRLVAASSDATMHRTFPLGAGSSLGRAVFDQYVAAVTGQGTTRLAQAPAPARNADRWLIVVQRDGHWLIGLDNFRSVHRNWAQPSDDDHPVTGAANL
jgi:hypothetical protein